MVWMKVNCRKSNRRKVNIPVGLHDLVKVCLDRLVQAGRSILIGVGVVVNILTKDFLRVRVLRMYGHDLQAADSPLIRVGVSAVVVRVVLLLIVPIMDCRSGRLFPASLTTVYPQLKVLTRLQ